MTRSLFLSAVLSLILVVQLHAQYKQSTQWVPGMAAIYQVKDGEILQVDLRTGTTTPVVSKQQLQSGGQAIEPADFTFSDDRSKLLLFTNTAKVWRYNTRGDYWLYDLKTKTLRQLGKGRPARSLMYAKFAPDGSKVAYVSEHNLFTETVDGGAITQLTSDGTRKMINGTFDWVYEEEFGCRDGFRWSPDSKQIAYWQVDATHTRDYFMLNTTDSNYSQVVPVEYPKVGEAPSPVRIGVVAAGGGNTNWMKIPGEASQHYLPRMEWKDAGTLVVQQLDRRQQVSNLMYCNANKGVTETFYTEKNPAWVEVKSYWNHDDPSGWEWLNKQKEFLWVSEADGWRHIYRMSSDGKKSELLTKGNYDIASVDFIDEAGKFVYFTASPDNPLQLYLFRVRLDGSGKSEQVTPKGLSGSHKYQLSPDGKYARHRFSNFNTPYIGEYVSLPDHAPLSAATSIAANIRRDSSIHVTYQKVTTASGTELDTWINWPNNFDSSKKYPVVFYVYGEPAAATVSDEFGNHQNFLYTGDMNADGYVQVGIDNRGTPVLKGAAWRKAIYRKIGTVNVQDMAEGAMRILERPYFDKERVAVWGWSGGGSSTLNLMFQYPKIFKTGIAIAAVSNQLFYDNIYQERYMGLPQENREDFIKGSPITYAKNLEGNLLLIHGTGDDNVHYSNAELMVNELVKQKKQFQFMAYPNRTHSISEGEGTFEHLAALYTKFLQTYCAPGPR